MEGREVVAWEKVPTTADVSSGVVAALKSLLRAHSGAAERGPRRDDRHTNFVRSSNPLQVGSEQCEHAYLGTFWKRFQSLTGRLGTVHPQRAYVGLDSGFNPLQVGSEP